MSEDIFWNLLAKKLAKEATSVELAQLEELMCQHPEWLYSARHIQDMWALPSTKTNSESENAFQQQLTKLKEKGVDINPLLNEQLPPYNANFFSKKRLYSIFAAASILGLISILFFKISSNNNQLFRQKFNEVSTHRGSSSKLTLPDGSTVWLNGGSKLIYDKDFGVKERHVVLEGEAFFDVVKMKELPFVIQTKVIRIKVLGTTFNVKSYEDDPTTETSLVKGKVEITVNSRPEEKFILLPQNKLIVSNEIVEKNTVSKKARTKKRLPLVLSRVRWTNFRAFRFLGTSAICWRPLEPASCWRTCSILIRMLSELRPDVWTLSLRALPFQMKIRMWFWKKVAETAEESGAWRTAGHLLARRKGLA